MHKDDTRGGPQVLGDPELPHVQYLPESDSFLCEVDVPGYSISEAVVSSVAVATGRDPIEMPPLYSVIDLDALDSLLASGFTGDFNREISVKFRYADCQVFVEDRKTVRVSYAHQTPADIA